MKNNASLVLNIILALALTTLLIKGNYIEKIFKKLNMPSSDPYNYKDNWQYKQEMGLYKHYNKKANIVMLGNSITYRANWNELLNRTDIANRGIGDDTTAGFLSRLQEVDAVHPKLCFVMGGINDIRRHVSSDSIVQNLNEIINRLINKQIRPVLLSILFVSEDYPNFKEINKRVKECNSRIKQISNEKSIDYIDLNLKLSENNLLKNNYSFDGIHLTGSGYSIIRQSILPIITKYIDNTDLEQSVDNN